MTPAERDPASGRDGGGESVATVIVAAAANLGIALAKAVAGHHQRVQRDAVGGGALRRRHRHRTPAADRPQTQQRPADEEHPLGYGPERYIWALLAAVATFVGGAVFSIYDGVHTLVAGEELGSPLVSYVVLGVAFLLEGYSLRTGLRQARGEAARVRAPFAHYLRYTPDTAVKAVVLEDSAALVGLVFAAGGLLGGQLTGSGVWDGVASLLIGALLLCVAWVLGRSNAELLIGRPLPRAMRERIRSELLAIEQVEAVLELTTLVQGPREALVAAKVDFRDVSTAAQIEWACERAEDRLREVFPSVVRVYLDPTPGYAQRRAEGLNPWP